ncbi:MAG: aspartate--tRNA ligase [Firmicutes bacterium]|nr:aspartate--tRNA ligase [Bacillota bacterium]
MRLKRTHWCGELKNGDEGERVVLAGWVQGSRDHGGLIFVDLRDRTGLVQLVFDHDVDPDLFKAAERLRGEYVIVAEGMVARRSADTVNPRLPTGEIEIRVKDMTTINPSRTPPFYIEDDIHVDENLRLRYRYLDLRRPEMFKKLRLRHDIIRIVRDCLDREGFIEVETPMLTRSTPEGARDYLVPGRLRAGSFFALPQSPQLFKQLLMVAGVERYFQIARCFRDEDLRADRQPEFTQIDMELSFADREEIFGIVESMLGRLWKEIKGRNLEPFPRISYREAMDRFGTDKPDLRLGMELADVSPAVARSDFRVFKEALHEGGVVKGLRVPGGGQFSRKKIDDLVIHAREAGASGLAWMVRTAEGWKSPISKFFAPDVLDEIGRKTMAEVGDLLLFVADDHKTACSILGLLRLKLGKNDSISATDDRFVWIVDFPLLEYDPEEKRHVAIHHPFTAPLEEDVPLLETEPLKVRARAYDLVLNGVEIGGGSIRIHQRKLQEYMFELMGIDAAAAAEKFGFLLEAFEYGAPPHGGIAFGLDRLIMLLAGDQSIREVIPFPKTAHAACLLTGAPAPVNDRQLEELHIRVAAEKSGKSGDGKG